LLFPKGIGWRREGRIIEQRGRYSIAAGPHVEVPINGRSAHRTEMVSHFSPVLPLPHVTFTRTIDSNAGLIEISIVAKCRTGPAATVKAVTYIHEWLALDMDAQEAA
jgi:hypothetical protein